jgi:hypothetical protein
MPVMILRRSDMTPVPASRSIGLLCILALGAGAQARAADAPPVRLYEITTEIGMPHLEENLRYATTREKQCLSEEQLFVRFPILSHVALQDCKLNPESRNEEAATYLLACDGGHGTIGGAVWRLYPTHVRGRLDVILGGKNMTFYQSVTAWPVGACTTEGE